MSDIIKILLEKEIPNPETKRVKIKRLSKHYGQDVVVELSALSFADATDCQKQIQATASAVEGQAFTVLMGEKSGLFKSEELQKKFGAATPLDLIQKMLTPGEISQLANQIETLSGFGTLTLENIKKK